MIRYFLTLLLCFWDIVLLRLVSSQYREKSLYPVLTS